MACKDCIHFEICTKGFPWADGKGGGWCEDFKDNSRYIKLPCKIEDKMWVVSRYYTGTWEIFECKVDEITIYEKHIFITLLSVKGNFKFGENVSSIGKNVFFTKEEAEKLSAVLRGRE